MDAIDAGINIDVAYDTTPERALYSFILKNQEFTTEGAQYIGERPAFMRVKANEIDLHDWDQYDRENWEPNSRGGPPTIDTTVRYDPPAREDQRVLFALKNVWTVLKFRETHPDTADRAYVSFRFTIQLPPAVLDGEKIWDGDHYWRCERKRTELLDE